MATPEQTHPVKEQWDAPKRVRRPRLMTPPPAPRNARNCIGSSGPPQSAALMPQLHSTLPCTAGDRKACGKGTQGSRKWCRAGVTRNIYGILLVQMLVTVAVAAVCSMLSSVRSLILATRLQGWLKLIMFIPTLACLLGLQRKGRVYPYNFFLLFSFTICISLNVGYVSALLFEAGLAHLFIQAAAITAVIFLELLVCALRSRQDCSSLRAFLPVALSVFLQAIFATWLLRFPILDTIATWCGAVIFSGYIIYDTRLISKRLDHDDYVLGAAELYWDIINWPLRVLQILLDTENGTKDRKCK